MSQDTRVVNLNEVEESLRMRAEGIDAWLARIDRPCKSEQKHCEEGTVERVYWHYGYMVAIKDVLDFLRTRSKAVN